MSKQDQVSLKSITPRVLRLKDAPQYLGMDRSTFNTIVRPTLVEIPIGERGIGFDVLDLDYWLEEHKQLNGVPTKKFQLRSFVWQKRKSQVSTNEKGSGTLTSKSLDEEFAKVLKQIRLRKRKRI